MTDMMLIVLAQQLVFIGLGVVAAMLAPVALGWRVLVGVGTTIAMFLAFLFVVSPLIMMIRG